MKRADHQVSGEAGLEYTGKHQRAQRITDQTGDDNRLASNAIAQAAPARRNHGTEETEIRLMISPEDAIGLAENLTHTARWLIDAERQGL